MADRKRFPREWNWPSNEKDCISQSAFRLRAFEKQSQVNLVGMTRAARSFLAVLWRLRLEGWYLATDEHSR